MNGNRHNIPRDETTRMVHSQCQADTYSWLRTLRAIRGLVEIASTHHRADIDTATKETGNV
jgi:hypothetical protein